MFINLAVVNSRDLCFESKHFLTCFVDIFLIDPDPESHNVADFKHLSQTLTGVQRTNNLFYVVQLIHTIN